MDESTPQPRHSFARSLWRSCASLRLAVMLLVLLAIACFVGIVLSQPASFQAERYLNRRLGTGGVTVEEFVGLARSAGVRVNGETFETFSARLKQAGVEEEEWARQFLDAFTEAVRRDQESEDCLRLFYVDEYGTTLGHILLGLQLHRVFSSVWFRLLCGLLIVNLVACSTQRLGGQCRAAFGLRPPKEPEWYGRRSIHRSLTLPGGVDEAADRVNGVRRGQGFLVPRRRSTGAATLDAARGWLGALGRFWWPLGRIAGLGRVGAQVVHLGIILIVFGGFISGRLGFRHAQPMAPGDIVAVPDASSRVALGRVLRMAWYDLRRVFRPRLLRLEDEAKDLAKPDWREGAGERPEKVAFRLALRSFDVRLDVQGKPEYYGAHVELLDREPPAEQVIEVNHPLVYRGYYAYQHSYQPDASRVTSVGFLIYEMSGEQGSGQHFHGADPAGEVQRRINVVAEPGVEMAVPGTSLKLQVLRYFPRCQVPLVEGPDGRQMAGAPRNDSSEFNPAVLIRLEAPGLGHRERLVFLPNQPGQPRGMSSFGNYLLGAVEFTPGYNTVLVFQTHPVMLPVWIGCAVVMLGIMLCFYCNHQRVWVLIRPLEGEAPAEPRCEVHLAGDSFKWREGFKERFEAIVSQISEIPPEGFTPSLPKV